jgi:hypothetical protein
MFNQAFIVLLVLWRLVDFVGRCTTPFLFNMGREAKGLGSTTRILSLVAAVLKFGLLRMVTAMVELGTDKLRFANCTLKSNQTRPNLPIDVLPFNVLLVVHVLNKTV